jgi:DNA-binding GntR family transcriptional regulator
MMSDVGQTKNVKLSSQADRCAFLIAEEIRNGTLRPGQKIGEESVAKKLGTGRAPVRIAFERLVSAGVLNRVHRAGTFVRKISLGEYCELSDVRAVLEGLAARLACERSTPADLTRLEKMAIDMDARLPAMGAVATPDWREIVRAETEFHLEIARLSGNRILSRILAVQDLVRFCFQVGMALDLSYATSQEVVPHHLAVVRALASRDPDRAEKTMRDHVLLAKEQRILILSGLRSKPAGGSNSDAQNTVISLRSKPQKSQARETEVVPQG